MLIATKGNSCLLPCRDPEGITANPRVITIGLVCIMFVCCQDGIDMKVCNFDLLMQISNATNGGRDCVTAMGDYNIKVEDLIKSGLVEALGLEIILPSNSSISCSARKHGSIDYTLIAKCFKPSL